MAWISNPLRELDKMQREMERLFDTFGYTPTREAFPLLNIYDDENNIIVLAETPGILREGLHISVREDVLRISGQCEAKSYGENSILIRTERCRGSFEKLLELPVKVKEDQITASLKDGVLMITLPKAEKVKAKSIEIQG
ncbi:MAG: Hsp20/alpha crystallin family protein [Candidatus Margulisiibacteriota bacterium]|nr:MAG: hypothetical protein A2X43_02705 [Candidatus Margulisbacteria bacterium GWD2_39_127]OGI02744.1 MAG: hypothetical protein A2X42_01740 [Candidatus Margulisbacteria bacterium GWF2_38_17]OGI09370.1 MAG: hypothetical protein A2X41_09635 [Candidatus Margulisbacteria bacterium GWE2_39_32]PZM84947.1 MAG: Hsp20/alpha crystallin family protein [Candidatus Margulisiibacteriota bacterium]HAR63646.1 hypothetical protein [Candidatus Margulisiibacteriota bacterium]